MRKLGSFLLGDGLGGSGVHWNGMNFRFFPYDFKIKTMTKERYGSKLSGDYPIQDWGLSYEELEPYYTKFENIIGVSGESVSPFDGKRSSPYPLPPLVKTLSWRCLKTAAKKIRLSSLCASGGYSLAGLYKPDGAELNPCEYCGHCERFGCEYNAKASPINTVIPVAPEDR
ncbi:MAG: hypothetical protein LRY51_03290 [Geovibrio sp.]|nr:hypothetical protein [Geovibrio sp.]